MVKLYPFSTYLARIEAPVGTLIVFVAIEAAAGNPLAIFEGALVDGDNGDLSFALGWCGEENAEALADAEELVGAGGHHEPITGLGVGAEDRVQRDVNGVAADCERLIGMLAVKIE